MAEVIVRCIECGQEMEEIKHGVEYETHVIFINPCETCMDDAIITQERVGGYS